MYFELTDSFVVSADADRTWEFFSSAENLPVITPPWLNFTIRTPRPIAIGQDAQLEYTIAWMGVPIRWRTRIIDWLPPHQFIDLQISGPYTLWHHQHRFEPDAKGTGCQDRVIYKLPFDPLSRPVNGLLIRRQLLDIFRFRRRAIRERLGWVRALQKDVRIRPIRFHGAA